tara:strand:- start:2119 stop:2658 length:540 start_codon:yes stop_codon:yes gene_type:complete
LSPAEVDGIGLILLFSAEEVIDRFSLDPHPEGGWLRRTYESTEIIESPNGFRPAGTSILYLLNRVEVSRLHSLDADETWYFHQGAPLLLHMFSKNDYHSIQLGNLSSHSASLAQYTIPAETIFGVTPCKHSNMPFSLVSCSVCPGYIDAGFSWPDPLVLSERFKKYSDLIEKLAPPVES